MKERVPHLVRATFRLDVETVIDARTPEEAESIFEAEYAGDLEQVAVVERQLESVEAYPESEEKTA